MAPAAVPEKITVVPSKPAHADCSFGGTPMKEAAQVSGTENGACSGTDDNTVENADEVKAPASIDNRARLRVRMLPYLLSWYDPVSSHQTGVLRRNGRSVALHQRPLARYPAASGLSRCEPLIRATAFVTMGIRFCVRRVARL